MEKNLLPYLKDFFNEVSYFNGNLYAVDSMLRSKAEQLENDFPVDQDLFSTITCYRDLSQLEGGSNLYHTISVAKDLAEIIDIKDARIYDGTSDTRSVHLNQIAILQNNNGFYAAVKVLKIEIDSDGKGDDKLIFEYCIQTNG